jgi:hypothetical protein
MPCVGSMPQALHCEPSGTGVRANWRVILTATSLIPIFRSNSSERFHFVGWTYPRCARQRASNPGPSAIAYADHHSYTSIFSVNDCCALWIGDRPLTSRADVCTARDIRQSRDTARILCRRLHKVRCPLMNEKNPQVRPVWDCGSGRTKSGEAHKRCLRRCL